MADVEDVGERSFAAKLNHLFETVVPVGRGPFRTEEVARAISSGSVSISGSYIWLLRKGQRDNPTLKHVEALARFFGVPPAYFFDDRTTQAVDGELELMVALRSAGVQHVALRAAGLSPRSLRSIKEIIEHARELEGLPGTAHHEEHSHDS
ncbi:Transcriptional regulator, contains XRE-family HTH domain [Streptomyces sp. 2224.1]|uniref:helix-turn-helix domain-containing protein n=1 Tax=unclassified Streptomyces TaxID=2593676 RepID=UPI00088C17A1|nr:MULTISPECIES: helix-turn-helix domain-containing protein [unclassified Streptomyces]PBC83670.1 transcriptional regulator with XRE-family HTH domain [Streptomyces sp. 2321.6]SDR40109.1 Transcriptional regulator, contains XRE-family HTH domain [Streptomyces sp. KS_16]SEB98356.1 Transcriptional regulator, contains XRE-family HTH domain [Streptomyces sp. 2224.1]SED04087.1 Transcriptional regulator, contains XRE-family HTH domain [Streptomyces sp. 2133.1]SEE72196.1 Transcriptional regulator, con